MSEDQIAMIIRLLAAVLAGALIGFERSFRGRPAGFRTHTLVCLASASLMLVTVYEWQWVQARTSEMIRLDPTRMAQGIMTGIGFLGAGVIFKEGITVRGLTTAASIWITAAIGILLGIGLYFPAVITTVLVLFALSAFRWVESQMPTQSYARLDIMFAKDAAMTEDDLRQALEAQGFSVSRLHYRLTGEGTRLEYRTMLHTADAENYNRLSRTLLSNSQVVEFRISPAND
jgi:putative Mg2+ transporter-C (MgtC) family protein